ncbi:MAG: histidinol dehydrogenase [Euryarchaeota archaeon]|nr:histidinol dehydrogenase [Euryarchaeota archaeon]
MEIVKLQNEEKKRLTKRSQMDVESVIDVVKNIINDVKEKGDKSLQFYTEKFDKVKLDDLKVSRADIIKSYDKIDQIIIKSIKKAAENIEKFHQAQIPQELSMDVDKGIKVGQIIRAIESVGCYIPGGRAIYPSTVLMTIIPAKIAGVERTICCTPPLPSGKVDGAVLAAADIAGADEIYKVGGAQAIAAMAFGTETIPKVDKIVGPGNIFVTAAKKLLYGDVDIDFIAGPSEVLIIADNKANPTYIAFDMLAQAEHDPNAACVLVTPSESLAESVSNEIQNNIKYMKRRETIEESLEKYGKIIISDSIKDAVEFANEYAPEHLILMTDYPENILKDIKNAGSIFLGELTPVSAGDYGSGTNHVLPTGGCARMYSGLTTESFIKKPTVQKLSKEGIENLKDVVIPLAEYEGLYAHAESFKRRLLDIDK